MRLAAFVALLLVFSCQGQEPVKSSLSVNQRGLSSRLAFSGRSLKEEPETSDAAEPGAHAAAPARPDPARPDPARAGSNLGGAGGADSGANVLHSGAESLGGHPGAR